MQVQCNLTILYTNIDVLTKSKINLLDVQIKIMQPDIICIVELLPKNVRTKPTIDAYQIRNYNIVTYDLSRRGIAVYARPNLSVNIISTVNNYEECVWCEVINKQEKMLLCCIYRSPSSSEENDRKLFCMLKDKLAMNYTDTIIVGDFNYSNIDWEQKCHTSRVGCADIFLDTINDLYLEQLVSAPTRYRHGQLSNILDLILTNNQYFVDDVTITDPIGKSDHCVICISVNMSVLDECKLERRMYYRGDYDAMREYLMDIDWKTRLENENIQSAWNIFQENISYVIDEFVPVTCNSIKSNNQPWINKEVLKHIKEKKQTFNKYIKRPTLERWNLYTEKRNLSTAITDSTRSNFETKVCRNSKDNPKTFWKYVNSKQKKQSQLSCLQDTNSILCYDDQTKSNLLNSYFSSVFIDDKETITSEKEDTFGLGSIRITPKIIESLINNLNISKAPGPDGIHAKIIKECSQCFSYVLCILFNKSFIEGVLPYQWKEANVRALFKKGSKTLCNNYRPVSLTSIVCKLLESIIRDAMLDYLESNNKIVVNQYGFRPGYSCSTQLLEVMEDFSSFIDTSHSFDCIYLDFAKAFDRVSHVKLISKLSSIGIQGNILKWITNFLSNRKQRVMVNGVCSEWSNVTSGIPQGSVLGPIMFTIFINDLPISLNSSVKIFADDTKIYNSIENRDVLQDDLDKLISWSNTWLLPFNVDKCSVVHYGNSNDRFVYTMDDKALAAEAIIKDLGIVFQEDLKFGKHINLIVASANSKLGIIRHTFHDISKENFVILFKAFVRPILEYCCTTWAPYSIMHHKEIEKVQKRATKLIQNMYNLSYCDRLKRLNLTTLYYRRLRMDMLQVYRIINGIDKINKDTYFSFNNRPSRNNSLKLIKPRAQTSIQQHSFSHRIVNLWNELPDEVVLAESVNSFKNHIEEAWKHKEWKYNMVYI